MSALSQLQEAALGFMPGDQMFRNGVAPTLNYGGSEKLPVGVYVRSPPQARDTVAVESESTAARAKRALEREVTPEGEKILVRPVGMPSKPAHGAFAVPAFTLVRDQVPEVHANDLQLKVGTNAVGLTTKDFEDLVVVGALAYPPQDATKGTVGPAGNGVALQRGGIMELINTGSRELISGQRIAAVGVAKESKTTDDGRRVDVPSVRLAGWPKDEPFFPLAIAPVDWGTFPVSSILLQHYQHILGKGSKPPAYETGLRGALPALIDAIAKQFSPGLLAGDASVDAVIRDLMNGPLGKDLVDKKPGGTAEAGIALYYMLLGARLAETQHVALLNKLVGVVTRGAKPGGVCTVALTGTH